MEKFHHTEIWNGKSLHPASQKFALNLRLLKEEIEGKDNSQKEILPTTELNTRQTLIRFFYQFPRPCLTYCSLNQLLVDLIGYRTHKNLIREECMVLWNLNLHRFIS